MNKSVKLKNQIIKNDTDKLTFISGPCLLESEKLVRLVAKNLIKYSKKKKSRPDPFNGKKNHAARRCIGHNKKICYFFLIEQKTQSTRWKK